MRIRSIIKVMRAEKKISSGRDSPRTGATMARISMAAETRTPVGIENFLILVTN